MKMKDIIDLIISNKEWLFSGLGLAIISTVVFIIKKESKPQSKIEKKEKIIKIQSNNKAGGNITNINIKGDIDIKH